MNDLKESAKVARTKHLIETQFKQMLERKNIKQISVNDICKRTMISRSAFYLHFRDKYDLLKYCLEKELKRWDTALDEKNIEDFIAFTLDSVLAARNLYYNAFFCEPTQEPLNIARDCYYQIFRKRLVEMQAKGRDVPQPVSTIAAFYTGAILSSIEQWLREDTAITKEELCKCLKTLMPAWFR